MAAPAASRAATIECGKTQVSGSTASATPRLELFELADVAGFMNPQAAPRRLPRARVRKDMC